MASRLRSALLIWAFATSIRADESNSQCFKCSCRWSDGLWSADCKNIGISEIPQTLDPSLKTIDFSENPLYELKANEFYNANIRDVHKLQLRNCSLEVINEKAFSHLGLLIDLNLSSNNIVVLHRNVFRDNGKLRILNLDQNKIRVLEDGLFYNMTHLQRIQMAHNAIERITPKVFDNVPLLRDIDLSYNNIKHMPEDFTTGLASLNSLSIQGNPWHCDCYLQNFRAKVVNKSLITSQTACEGPPHLKGKEWKDRSVIFACAPQILYPTANRRVEVASPNYTLVCKVKGQPSPDVEWYINGRLLRKDSRRPANKYVIERNSEAPYTWKNVTILNVGYHDRGDYKCVARNSGGEDETNVTLVISSDCEGCGASNPTSSTSTLPLLLGLVIAAVLLILIIVLILLCFCCKKNSRNYASKRHDLSQSSEYIGLDGRPEMEKALITEVNPIVKPPRHQTITSSVTTGATEVSDINKTLLDRDSIFTGDDESRSYEFDPKLSAKSQSNLDASDYHRQDHPYPPDLLPAFPPRAVQVSPAGSSASTVADTTRLVPHHVGPQSPLGSPMYDTIGPYRTLPYSRSHSPFVSPMAPPMRTPRQAGGGYVTIPRRPRQSWSSEPPPVSDIGEPLYDNLGIRATATGRSMQSINKAGDAPTPKSGRPFPMTPLQTIDPIAEHHEPVAATLPRIAAAQRPLFEGRRDSTASLPTPDGRPKKVPPAPPPKPSKRASSARPLFEDEGEDGTEV